MLDSIRNFFVSEDFMPHGHCFLWQADILWLHVASDAGIALAYFAIPLVLIYLVRMRVDLPFEGIFLLFGAFILLCGITHLMSIWVIWHPDYALEGVLKALTAIVSIVTFFVALKLVPHILRLPSTLHMAAIIMSTADAILSKTMDGIITSWNPGAEALLGYRADEIIGKHISTIIPKERAEEESFILNEVRQGRRVDNYETIRVSRNGHCMDVSICISPIYDKNGHVIGASKIIRNITDRKKNEQKMERMVGELIDSNAQLENFAYVCSHDLQEPLRMISNYTQRLEKHLATTLDDQGRHYMQYVVDSALRARQLVSDVLSLARIGNEDKKLQIVDCNLILNTVLSVLQERIQETNATITHDELPKVKGYAIYITQILQNLVGNALKFHGNAAPVIHIGAVRNGDFWLLSVCDNGIGIELEYRHKIFEVFQRLHSREEYPGTGIGLAIVKKIIDQHGGKIWLESELGRGTTFFFTLPAA